jgi:hypothetical protein
MEFADNYKNKPLLLNFEVKIFPCDKPRDPIASMAEKVRVLFLHFVSGFL